MKQRIEYLDFLKMIAIFLVLLGHSTEQISSDLFWDHPVWSFIYSFHMPLFMFLCGTFFCSSLKRTYKDVLSKKMIQLGIPSLTAYAICVVIMLASGERAIFDLCDLSFSGFMNSVWFLKCVLFCYIIMYPLCRLTGNDVIASTVAIILITFFPKADTVNLNFMLPMFCLGMLCGNRLELVELHRKSLTLVSLAVFAFLMVFWSGRLTVYMVPTRVIDPNTGTIDFSNLGLTAYRLATGMAGSMLLFLLSKPVFSFLSRFRISDFLCRIGSATLGIYFLQTFLLEIFVHSLHVFIPIPWSYVVAPLIAIVELFLCYVIVLALRRTKFLRLLVLGETAKTN